MACAGVNVMLSHVARGATVGLLGLEDPAGHAAGGWCGHTRGNGGGIGTARCIQRQGTASMAAALPHKVTWSLSNVALSRRKEWLSSGGGELSTRSKEIGAPPSQWFSAAVGGYDAELQLQLQRRGLPREGRQIGCAFSAFFLGETMRRGEEIAAIEGRRRRYYPSYFLGHCISDIGSRRGGKRSVSSRPGNSNKGETEARAAAAAAAAGAGGGGGGGGGGGEGATIDTDGPSVSASGKAKKALASTSPPPPLPPPSQPAADAPGDNNSETARPSRTNSSASSSSTFSSSSQSSASLSAISEAKTGATSSSQGVAMSARSIPPSPSSFPPKPPSPSSSSSSPSSPSPSGGLNAIPMSSANLVGTRTGLFRAPISGGVQSATSAHGLPSPALAVRNLIEQAKYAHLCTVMSRMHHRRRGYPFGSLVDFACDATGHPIFCLSPLAIHTRNLLSDPRSTLVVQIPGWSGLANARVTLFGDVHPLPVDDQARAQQLYLAKNLHGPSHQWGNFNFFRMDLISDIYFVGGFGTVAWVDYAEYASVRPDKIATTNAEDTLQSLNNKFSLYVKQLLKVDLCQEIDDAAIISIDGKGIDIRVRQGARFNIQRMAFETHVDSLDEATCELDRIIHRALLINHLDVEYTDDGELLVVPSSSSSSSS
ncbi:hypothetical protein CBR_g66806 [Chara braunii]|uniref:CREG-like beta-barrel domain-containing protein n=1 Tax=Chara braunii TaxID=69332 RepID=A0A388K9H0_CHABU|nr:hypothetical protein CBR_g66806 [Chara braunii]|eukprot:GBG66671.1 hypothetical protein CBR_g66806 [Chara braunii]